MILTYTLITIIVLLLLFIFGSGIFTRNTISKLTINYHHAREFIVNLGMWHQYSEYCARELKKAGKEKGEKK